jgi:hypothetical protein
MNILDDIEKFTDYVPTASGSSLQELKPFLEEAEQWIQDKLTGPDLHDRIARLPATGALKRNAQAVICLRAYETAIPFLDLVQTPNGFAVVSNQNQAPASKERVERLLAFVARRLTDALDKVICTIHASEEYREEWKKAPAFKFRTEIVFLTTAELQNYTGNRQAGYQDLDASHPAVLHHQAKISGYISGNYLRELLQKRAGNSLSDFEQTVFRAVRSITGLLLQGEKHYPLIEELVNNLAANPGQCPTYIQSPEYRLKISQKYENRKNDPAFFFG